LLYWKEAGKENITGVQIQCNCTVVTRPRQKMLAYFGALQVSRSNEQYLRIIGNL